jgi:tRNA uridine 5-carboxymethylaminomethyl modification enzyme
MLTARAEYRLSLRADNAEARLTPLAIDAGCVSSRRRRHFEARQTQRQKIENLLAETATGAELRGSGAAVRDDGVKRTLADWLRFPEVNAEVLLRLAPQLKSYSVQFLEEAVQDHFYAPYLARQQGEVERLRADEAVRIPPDLDYTRIAGLSSEMVERLSLARPATLGAASRIRGVTPAALAAILVHSRRKAA